MIGIIGEPLNAQVHNRDGFYNKDEKINLFLKERANKERAINLSDTYVLVKSDDKSKILGYFTLSLGAVLLTELPVSLVQKLPKYKNYGTVLLGRMGRMGRDHNLTPKGFGQIILRAAMIECLNRQSFFALELHAKNEALVNYYKNFGFIQLVDDKCHLILPKKTIEKAISS